MPAHVASVGNRTEAYQDVLFDRVGADDVGVVQRRRRSTGLGKGGGVDNLGDFTAVDTIIAGNRASTSNDDVFA